MNLTVDKEKCIGCGQCVSICEDVFNFDDDNLAKVVQNPVEDKYKDEAMSALESCPTSAIVEE
ncbi:MAG: ferredoxin [Bacilli bacterium]|nr:ferredoxin [Bacilli bacterium]